jgi:uncharacterized protein
MPGVVDKFSRLAALMPARAMASRPATRRAPEDEDALGRLFGAAVARNHYGEHVSVSNWFSTPEFAEPSSAVLELLCRTRDVEHSRRTQAAFADPSKWLFLDTETTGLSGGTGTYAFLIGLAWWDSGGLQVEQFFMRDFHEEHSILHELSVRLADRPVLVTFNGKSFDWPLLENRFTMTRAIAIPRLAAHVDLLHPARALWKLRLGSVRLVELERHVLDASKLGWHREEDILSALIPQHYFDYLRGGPAAPLAAVVRHNQMDLRGLAAIMGRIDALLAAANRADQGVDSLDLFGLSRFLQRRGDADRAHAACSHALDLGLPSEIRPRARRELALLAKRRGDDDQAVVLWHQLAAETTVDVEESVHACAQLAIHYERRAKNLPRAMEFATLALAKVSHLRSSSREPQAAAHFSRMEEQFLNRVARLQHRMALAAGARSFPLLEPSSTGFAVGKRASGTVVSRKIRI